jgi:hypothetical protein
MKLTVQLVHNEKSERDRAFKQLKKWMQGGKACETIKHEPLEAAKLWKALYYCMWNADKPHIQQHVAEEFASLVHCLPSDVAPHWIRCFWAIVDQEWTKMDQHRLDKYYSLMRHILRQTFVYASQLDNALEVRELLDALTETCLKPSSMLKHRDVALHVVDVYMPELLVAMGSGSGEQSMSWEMLVEFFGPLNVLLQNPQSDWHVVSRIIESGYAAVFQEIAVEDDDEEKEQLHKTLPGEEEEIPEEPVLVLLIKQHAENVLQMLNALKQAGVANKLSRPRRDDLRDLVILFSQVTGLEQE